jgi:hypothetical protein
VNGAPEGRESQDERDREERGLFDREGDRFRPRRVMQAWRMPDPDRDEVEKAGSANGGRARSRGPERGARPAAISGAATATTDMWIAMWAAKEP